jgi:hypothetical protein
MAEEATTAPTTTPVQPMNEEVSALYNENDCNRIIFLE